MSIGDSTVMGIYKKDKNPSFLLLGVEVLINEVLGEFTKCLVMQDGGVVVPAPSSLFFTYTDP